ncbi:Protein of unknown function [Natronincola peptidivorans]|uniref:DUF4236 domain-containing protein n=1 Tax=Natronincola peptidivorans TaxID=426128 RepID=A0A1I0C9T1_9FIRM|nr:DUF4236 domain-containing protein [Natronincola peptidivorans]SET16180.1 Protein of unknown function [Natronincola peptidivorans]
MGLRFRKSVNLGKGIRLNISKSGLGVSSGVKGLRMGVGPRGIRTTASIPGTGISYVKEKSLKQSKSSKEKRRLEVTSKDLYSPYMPQEVPHTLRSKQYHLQSLLGLIGIGFIFASFKSLSFLIIGLLCIYGKGAWRKKTDFAAKNYQDAVNYFKTKKYEACIEAIDHVLSHPNASQDLSLTKAECCLELGKLEKAYTIYKDFFHRLDTNSLSSLYYWPPKATTIAMAVEKGDYDFALKLLETLPEEIEEHINFPLWKNYYKGLCFIGKHQYEIAVEAFKNAIGRKRRMEEPYIDCHYYLGVAYAKLGKMSLAQQRFQRVYSANTSYKDIAAIITALEAGDSIEKLL